jgi:CDP-diacylglycerol---glycerol-3-phosphate 3-phosphatidyltransferase
MPSLYSLKSWFTGVLAPVLRVAIRLGLSPDFFTVFGLAGAALAAIGVVQCSALLVTLGCIVRLAGANLDGALARARGKDSPHGFLKNEIGDRLADFILLGSFAFLPIVDSDPALLQLVVFAVVISSLPTMISLLGYAKGAPRLNGGPVGKTERCLIVVLTVLALQLYADGATVLRFAMWVLIFGAIATALLRRRTIAGILATKGFDV